MPEIIPHFGFTLLEAQTLAHAHGMHLVEIGGEIRISPVVPHGARQVCIKVKISAADRGRVVAAPKVAA